MHPHAPYLSPVTGQPHEGTHGNDAAMGYPYVELTSGGDILGLNAVEVFVLGGVSSVGVDLEQRDVVELPHGVMVGGDVSANLHGAVITTD